MNCIEKTRTRIINDGLIAPGSKIIAAVSGGPDSMALLTILSGLSEELGFELAAAFFDHGIRPETTREKKLVSAYCARIGITLFTGSGNVPSRSSKTGMGIEESARLMRHAFLEKTASDWKADAVALGHHRDDQVETILHHIIRGAGMRGIAGMPVRRGIFIRPVIDCARNELKDLLREKGIRYAIDNSNSDNRFIRNRIRNRLIPLLKRDFNPSVEDSIIRLGENVLEGWRALSERLEESVRLDSSGEGVRARLSDLGVLNDFEIYIFLDRTLREHFGIVQDIQKSHYDAGKKLIRSGRSGKKARFPHGVTLIREHRHLRFISTAADQSPGFEGEIIIPGEGSFPLVPWNISLDVSTLDGAEQDMKQSSDEAHFSAVAFPVRVRNRRTGDRIDPLGMRGSKKLSDIFIDRKIPLHKRKNIPVFEDKKGIIWVPGVVRSERTRVRSGTGKRIVRMVITGMSG